MFRHRRMIGFRVDVSIEPDEVGFHAYCPALKGLHTSGDTEEEALQNVRDAAIAYLRASIKHGDDIPIGVTMHEEPDDGVHIVPREDLGRHTHTESLAVPCTI